MDGNCSLNDIHLIQTIGRTLVLIFSTLGSIFSIYLGWRLYKDAMLSPVAGELEMRNIKLRLTAGGPGIFFAAFGMVLLSVLVTQHLAIEVRRDASPTSLESREFNLGMRSHLYRVADAPPAKEKKCPPCMFSDTSVYAAGDQLSRTRVQSALQTALDEIKRGEQGVAPEASEDKTKERLNAISVLQILLHSLDKN